jgi:hypothetical protein
MLSASLAPALISITAALPQGAEVTTGP